MEGLLAVLALEGFRTEVLDGGCPAAQAPSALMPDTVILDIEMPLCDGFTVAEAMHESTEWRRLPLLPAVEYKIAMRPCRRTFAMLSG